MNVLDRLSPAAAFAVKLFAAAKLDFHALLAAGDEQALKAHLEKSPATADITAAVEAATRELQSRLDTSGTQLSALGAQLGAVTAALGLTAAQLAVTPENLAKFGVKDDDEFKKLAAAQQQEKLARAAVDHAISARTVAQIRELGIDAGNLPASQAGGTPKSTSAELLAEYNRLLVEDAGKAAAFFTKNFDAMFPATGGRN